MVSVNTSSWADFVGGNMFQTSRDRGNKSLGMLWNVKKHLFGTFHRWTGPLSTSDSIMMGRMKGSARVGRRGPPLCEAHDSKIFIHELKKHVVHEAVFMDLLVRSKRWHVAACVDLLSGQMMERTSSKVGSQGLLMLTVTVMLIF